MNKKAFIKYLLSQFKLIKKKNKVKKIALHEPSFSKFDEINLKKELYDLIDAGLNLSKASKYLAKKNNLTKRVIYDMYKSNKQLNY